MANILLHTQLLSMEIIFKWVVAFSEKLASSKYKNAG